MGVCKFEAALVWRVPGQPELLSETLSEIKNENNNNNNKRAGV